MANSTVPIKTTGDLLTAAEVNNIVAAVNSKADTTPAIVTFSQSIPFNTDYSLMNHTVTAAIAFVPNVTDIIVGGGAYVRLIADGVHSPTFDSSFVITAGEYDNTAGAINRIIFLWNGYEYEVSITQLGVIDITAPTVTSRTATTIHNIAVVFSEAVSGTIAGYSATINGGSPITPDSVSGTTTRTLVFSETFSDSDTILLSYSSSTGDTVDASSNPLASFTAQAVTNTLDTTAPTVSSATATDAHTIRIIFSETTTPTTAGWSFNNGSALTVTGVTGSGTTWNFAITETMTSGDTITRSYNSSTGNTLDAHGNELVTFTTQAVTNSVPSSGNGTPTIVNYTDPAWTFTGSWTDFGSSIGNFSGGLCSGGVSFAEIDFVDGIKFSFESSASWEGGYYSFSVDGGSATVVQALDASPLMFEVHPNDGGPHTLHICLDSPNGQFIFIKNITTYQI